jgi:hypothetical protein
LKVLFVMGHRHQVEDSSDSVPVNYNMGKFDYR